MSKAADGIQKKSLTEEHFDRIKPQMINMNVRRSTAKEDLVKALSATYVSSLCRELNGDYDLGNVGYFGYIRYRIFR